MYNLNNEDAEQKFIAQDIKETSKRMRRLCYVAISITVIVTIIELFNKNYISAGITVAKICSSCLVLLLLRLGYFKIAKTFIFIQINTFLLSVAFTIGHQGGGYMYFFPLIFALPMLVNSHKKQTVEISIYLAITAVCFYISIFWGKDTSTLEYISPGTYSILFHVNCFFAIVLSAIFAYLGVHFERKYVAALLVEKQKVDDAMHARTRFLSTMGHELRTPLNGIIGVSGLLQKEEILPEQQEYLTVLKYCSDHMLNLVNDILDFNKIEADRFELHPVAINLRAFLINSALPFYNSFEEKNIDLVVDVDDKLDEVVMVDDIRLTQVMNNLLSNALKFTIKGKVTLKVTCVDHGDGKVTARFDVEDTGIGMRKEDAAKVFGGFWQVYHESSRRYAGTGLGLNITQRLLKLMHADLELVSDYGVGTTFYFTLTMPIGQLDAKKVIEESAIADLSGYRILIADDNPINMLVAKKILHGWKLDLTTCKNGREVLNCLKEDNAYDMILLDLEMPDIDGYTAAAEVKKLYPEIPMMAFTAALVDNDLYDKLMGIGFADCVLKPFQPKELLIKIKQFLN